MLELFPAIRFCLPAVKNWAGETGYKKYLAFQPGDYSKFRIKGVWFFDHGEVDKIHLGDEKLKSGSNELGAFLSDMGTALTGHGSDAVINFRNCHSADNPHFLQELADGTGHTTTGVEGRLGIYQKIRNNIGIPQENWGGPDYYPEFGLWKATPGGGLPNRIWKNPGGKRGPW